MRSGGNNFNYFPENQLNKLAHLSLFQFKHVLTSCLWNWGWVPTPLLYLLFFVCGAYIVKLLTLPNERK